MSIDIAAGKKRLQDLRGLQSGFLDYGNSVKRRKNRLHISKWLSDLKGEPGACPSCGSAEHAKANAEIEKIAKAFEKLEQESKKVAEVPGSFTREEENLRSEIDQLLEKKKLLNSRFDLLRVNDTKVQEEFQQRKNMFLFLGQLRANFEYFKKLGDDGQYQKEIEKLQEEYDRLKVIIDSQGVAKRVQAATDRISSKMLEYLKTLDVESKYQEVAPKFDIKDLNIKVLGSADTWHYLSQVGSASNWVSFHVALMCALQDYFNSIKNSPVPSFVIFDQPSQVYFPKLRKGVDNPVDDIRFEVDEDAEAVRKIFSTIASSISKSSGMWQAIVLDHADETIYGNEAVHEVAVWRNGAKLIPTEWYEE